MGTTRQAKPVKLFISIFSGSLSLIDRAERSLSDTYGLVDYRSAVMEFDFTDYYQKEFGSGLRRRFIAFEELVDPGNLATIKADTNSLEMSTAIGGNRTVNMDPGYISAAKVVLATTKDYSHRIYLDMGIYGEVTLSYRGGSFRPFAWTYPDYRSGEYLHILEEVRTLYMQQLKNAESIVNCASEDQHADSRSLTSPNLTPQ